MTLNAIHPHPNQNTDGGHHVLNLNTGEVLTRPRVTVTLMTDSVRDHIEVLAAQDNVTEMKFFDGKTANLIGLQEWTMTKTNLVMTCNPMKTVRQSSKRMKC